MRQKLRDNLALMQSTTNKASEVDTFDPKGYVIEPL